MRGAYLRDRIPAKVAEELDSDVMEAAKYLAYESLGEAADTLLGKRGKFSKQLSSGSTLTVQQSSILLETNKGKLILVYLPLS
jgi:hypothetical protein